MKKSYLTRRENIILSAIDIINERGIHELSTREIAKRQGVTDGSLYRHFKSKEEILLAVLDYYSRYDSSIIKTIEAKGMKAKEGIIFFIRSFVEYYENYPSITSIVHSYEILIHDEVMGKKVKEIFYNRINYIEHLVKRGQQEGDICCRIAGEDLSSLIIGLVRTVILKWRFANYGFSLKDKVLTALEALININ